MASAGAPMTGQHLRSIERARPSTDLDRACSTSPTTWSRCAAARSRRCRRCGGGRSLSLFFEDSTRTRLSFETAAKRLSADTMTFSASSQRQQGREPARHRGDARRHGRSTPWSCATARPGVPWQIARWTDGQRRQRRRRLARAPHPGAARRLHDATEHPRPPPWPRVAAARGLARRHRRRRQAQPGGPLRRRWPSPRSAAQVTLVAPRTLLPPSWLDGLGRRR